MRSSVFLRRGYLTVAVLAVMFTVSSILLSMLPGLLRARREGRFDTARLQAEMLARAGVLRAKEKLRVDPDYRGEAWQVGIGPETPARGKILIKLTNQRSGEMELAIVARYLPNGTEHAPNAFEHSVQYEINLQLKTTSSEITTGDNK
jgi:hypothetical protein